MLKRICLNPTKKLDGLWNLWILSSPSWASRCGLLRPGSSLDFSGGSKSTRPACVRPARSLPPFGGAARMCSGSGRHQIGEPCASGLVKAVAPPGRHGHLCRGGKQADGADARDYLVSSPVSALASPEGFTDGEMAAGHTYEIKDVPGERRNQFKAESPSWLSLFKSRGNSRLYRSASSSKVRSVSIEPKPTQT